MWKVDLSKDQSTSLIGRIWSTPETSFVERWPDAHVVIRTEGINVAYDLTRPLRSLPTISLHAWECLRRGFMLPRFWLPNIVRRSWVRQTHRYADHDLKSHELGAGQGSRSVDSPHPYHPSNPFIDPPHSLVQFNRAAAVFMH